MDSSQDKNLPATGRKLQKARDDGQTARSRDLSHLAILGVGMAALLVLGPWITEALLHGMGQQLAFDAATVKAPTHMLERLRQMLLPGLAIAIVFALLTSSASVLSAIGAGGWIFSAKPIEPQFNRLNPLKGLANLFSKQQLTNVAKMVLLTAILCFVAWKYLSANAQRMAALVLQPSPLSLRHAGEWVVSGVALMLVVVLLFAVIDVPLQAYLFKERLKMSHQEVKQEHKESEGSPETKGRIRQKQREIADRASVGAVPKADFVVMNPTHYAVALRYDEATMGAPQVISKGTDLLAFKIREIAQSHDIPVLQSPMLARALYAHADLDQPIPAQLYTAVAQVLAYVYRLKAALRGQGEMPGDPPVPDAHIPLALDPHAHAVRPGAAR